MIRVVANEAVCMVASITTVLRVNKGSRHQSVRIKNGLAAPSAADVPARRNARHQIPASSASISDQDPVELVIAARMLFRDQVSHVVRWSRALPVMRGGARDGMAPSSSRRKLAHLRRCRSRRRTNLYTFLIQVDPRSRQGGRRAPGCASRTMESHAATGTAESHTATETADPVHHAARLGRKALALGSLGA